MGTLVGVEVAWSALTSALRMTAPRVVVTVIVVVATVVDTVLGFSERCFAIGAG